MIWEGTVTMKATVSRMLFGLFLGLSGGICVGLLTRGVVQSILRPDYNAYYAGVASEMPTLSMILMGAITGILVPMINKPFLRPVVGAILWMLVEIVFLSLPFAYRSLFMPARVIGACGVISAIAGASIGAIAAWVDFP